MSAMTQDEWTERYATQIQQRAGWSREEAMVAARVGAIEYERNERAAGNAITWADPEDCADDEMSYWENDGA